MAPSNLTPMMNSYSAREASAGERRNERKRRSHIEVQAEILKALASEYLTVNQLAIRVNLNRVLAKGYVRELSQKGHVERKKAEGLEKFSATQRGLVWLKRFETFAHD